MYKTLITIVAATCALINALIASDKPNILFITMDDMNWDSMGAYGCLVENISPHMDSLAERGMRFQHAFVNSPVCGPSRNIMQTGCYPHVSGVRGFYSVVFPERTVPELLRKEGYYTGILQKVPDSTPTNDYPRYWNSYNTLPKATYRTPTAYGKAFETILKAAKKQGKPFYAVINVIDPHLPFYRGPKTMEGEWDQTPPSKIYNAGEVPVPGFLPQSSNFDQEVADYYCSVKRGDDCVGAVLDVLKTHDLEARTIIIFLSDHGMSFPFAKSTLNPAGVRTPWIVVWPGVAEPGYVDTEHMISTIDFLPTIMDMTGAAIPAGLEGRSIVPLVKGERQAGRDYVYVEFNENPNADVRPARGVYTRDFAYIFNPWSNGKREAVMESRWYRSYSTFAKLAASDTAIAKRFDFLNYRSVEELYNYTSDPNALNNLIDNPSFGSIRKHLTEKLEARMQRTNDYVLEAFAKRNDPDALEAFMAKEDKQALERSIDTEWKRWRNRSGPTDGHTKYHDPANDL